MSHQNAIGSALYATLVAAPGTAIWGTRVYDRQAPQGAILPYVVFAFVGGGDTNQSPSRIVDATYDVQCVAETSAAARNGATAIGSALHDQQIAVSGWNTIAVTEVGLISLVDNVERRQFWQDGASYRIRISK